MNTFREMKPLFVLSIFVLLSLEQYVVADNTEEIFADETPSNNKPPTSSRIFANHRKQKINENPSKNKQLLSSKISANHREQKHNENNEKKEILRLETTEDKGYSDDQPIRRNKPFLYTNLSRPVLLWVKENLLGVNFVGNFTKFPNNNQSLTSETIGVTLSTLNQLKNTQSHYNKIFTVGEPSKFNESQFNTEQPISSKIFEVSESSTSSKKDQPLLSETFSERGLSSSSKSQSNDEKLFSSKIFANHTKQKPSTSRNTQSNNEQPLFNDIVLTTELPTSSKTKSNNDQLLSSDELEYSVWSCYNGSNNGKTPSDENLPNNELLLAVQKFFDIVWTAFRMHKESHNDTKTARQQIVLSDEPPPRSQITLLNFTDLIPTNEGLGCDRIAFLINLNRTNKWKAVPDLQVIPYPKVGYRWQEGESINVKARAKYYHDPRLPSSYDSRKIFSICSSLREPLDQGCNCLASWAVSAASAFSDRLCISSNGTINTQVSAQHVLSCSDGEVCKGRQSLKAWMYFKNHGVFSGSHYGQTRGCQSYLIEPCMESTKQKTYVFPLCSAVCQPSYFDKNLKPILYKASRAYSLINTSINAIKHEIFRRGPVTAEIKVFEDFQCYKSGIYNHVVGEDLGYTSVKVIGWGQEKNTPYWLIANTWGVQWGEQGFARVLMEASGINIESYISAGIPITDLELVEVF